MDNIGDWTPADVRRFIKGEIANDPTGMLPPKTTPPGTYAQGQTSEAGTVNITANVTPISPVRVVTLDSRRPVIVVWTAGALANSSGVSQNIQMGLFRDGNIQSPILAAFGNTANIANGTTLQLTSATFVQLGVDPGVHTYDIRFSVGDGTPSIRFIGNSYSNPGVLSVFEVPYQGE